MADINSILNQLRQERDRIDHAISILGRGQGTRKSSNGRRKAGPRTAAGKRRGKRRLSAAARKKISEAAKARWAKAKKAGRNSL